MAGATPTNGGSVSGTLTTINAGPGDQTEPHVSGDLVSYTDRVGGTSTIHYFDFADGSDQVVPSGDPSEQDFLSDVQDGRIAFSRLLNDNHGTTTAMLFDLGTGTVTNMHPAPGSTRFGAVIGGDTVAWSEFAAGSADLFAYDAVSGTSTNLDAHSAEIDYNPNLAPSGDLVVWEQCVGSNCDVLKSVRTGGTWGSPEVVDDASPSNEGNPDTDGTTIVYDSNRSSATDHDIYLQPASGGPGVPLEMAGFQTNPAISAGVISFESRATAADNTDVFLYVIATNTLYQLTDTPAINETLNDISLLPSGDVRVVWATDDDAFVGGEHNIYATTVTVPLTPTPLPADQTITFGPLPDRTFGDPPFVVAATASSGLPVTFSVPSGPCAVSAATVTILGPRAVRHSGEPGRRRRLQPGDAGGSEASPSRTPSPSAPAATATSRSTG